MGLIKGNRVPVLLSELELETRLIRSNVESPVEEPSALVIPPGDNIRRRSREAFLRRPVAGDKSTSVTKKKMFQHYFWQASRFPRKKWNVPVGIETRTIFEPSRTRPSSCKATDRNEVSKRRTIHCKAATNSWNRSDRRLVADTCIAEKKVLR